VQYLEKDDNLGPVQARAFVEQWLSMPRIGRVRANPATLFKKTHYGVRSVALPDKLLQ